MAAKETSLSELSEMIERGFAAVASDIAGVKGEVSDLKTEMMAQFEHTDQQFQATHDRLRDISAEIAVIHRRIERLEEQGASHAGFAKEIDHALERIAAIEKHLGIDKKIAA
jgi:chromosome segregation ATPase